MPVNKNYVREYSKIQLVSSAIGIASRHYFIFLGVFLGCMLILFAPIIIIELSIVFARPGDGVTIALRVVEAVLYLVIALGFTPAAMTFVTSDLVLGNKPSVIRACKRAVKCTPKLVGTTLLSLLYTLLGLILLIIPGLMAATWHSLSSVVVALEGLSPRQALKRSRSLTESFRWRIVGLIMLNSIIFILVPDIALKFALMFLGANIIWSVLLILLIYPFIILGFFILYLTLVLQYYDLRVRKEAYDMAALSEDLMR